MAQLGFNSLSSKNLTGERKLIVGSLEVTQSLTIGPDCNVSCDALFKANSANISVLNCSEIECTGNVSCNSAYTMNMSCTSASISTLDFNEINGISSTVFGYISGLTGDVQGQFRDLVSLLSSVSQTANDAYNDVSDLIGTVEDLAAGGSGGASGSDTIADKALKLAGSVSAVAWDAFINTTQLRSDLTITNLSLASVSNLLGITNSSLLSVSNLLVTTNTSLSNLSGNVGVINTCLSNLSTVYWLTNTSLSNLSTLVGTTNTSLAILKHFWECWCNKHMPE